MIGPVPCAGQKRTSLRRSRGAQNKGGYYERTDLRDVVDFDELAPVCSFYGLGCGRMWKRKPPV